VGGAREDSGVGGAREDIGVGGAREDSGAAWAGRRRRAEQKFNTD